MILWDLKQDNHVCCLCEARQSCARLHGGKRNKIGFTNLAAKPLPSPAALALPVVAPASASPSPHLFSLFPPRPLSSAAVPACPPSLCSSLCSSSSWWRCLVSLACGCGCCAPQGLRGEAATRGELSFAHVNAELSFANEVLVGWARDS